MALQVDRPKHPIFTPYTPPIHPLHTPNTPPTPPLYNPYTPLYTPPINPLYTPYGRCCRGWQGLAEVAQNVLHHILNSTKPSIVEVNSIL